MFNHAQQGETQYELAESQAALLGGGADLTGRLVEYCGHCWTIKGKNYLGDWDVERRENHRMGGMTVTSSIAAAILPDAHPHFARLVPNN